MKRTGVVAALFVLSILTRPLTTTALAAECQENFSRSELWLFSFNHFHCTSRGWSISRRVSDSRTDCAALHTSGQLIFVADSGGAEVAILRDLEHNEWVTTADQFAEVRISVDGVIQFEELRQVEVSASPPLRYGSQWALRDQSVQALRRGNVLNVKIADVAWDIGLSGSLAAIDATRACAAWKPGQPLYTAPAVSRSSPIRSKAENEYQCCLAIQETHRTQGLAPVGQCPPKESIVRYPGQFDYFCEMWTSLKTRLDRGAVLRRCGQPGAPC